MSICSTVRQEQAVPKQKLEYLLHNGEIWVESTLGVGSRFFVKLPISKEQVKTQPTQYQLPVQPVSEETEIDIQTVVPVEGQFKILIVDDEPVNLQVLVNHLSLQNYTIIQASSGMEALEQIEEAKPDIILLDIMMPKQVANLDIAGFMEPAEEVGGDYYDIEVTLNTGDVAVLYTDGITEAINIEEEEYGIERLSEVVKQHWQNSAKDIREAVFEDLLKFVGKQKILDDITLLVLKQ